MRSLILSGALALSFAAAQPLHAQTPNLPAGDGRDILAVACTQCHGLGTIVAMRDGPNGWRSYIDYMIMKGAQLTQPETDKLVNYLAVNFGPGAPPPATNPPTAVTLPAGAGKDLVETRCTVCHDLTRVVALKRRPADWDALVGNMMNRGAPIGPDERQTIVSYLAAQFGSP
jgi:mono/diheme cytochrome c family protein